MYKKFEAKVIKGLGIGTRLGFPTANLEIKEDFNLPFGVYAVEVIYGKEEFKGVLFYGERKSKISLEVHILDFINDIAGKKLIIGVLDRIRDVEVFDSEEELKKRIKSDIKKSKMYY